MALGYCNCVLKHSYQGGVEFMEHFSSFLLVFQLLNHLDSLSNILLLFFSSVIVAWELT